MVNIFFKVTWKRFLLFILIFIILNLIPFEIYPCRTAGFYGPDRGFSEWSFNLCSGAIFYYIPIFMPVGPAYDVNLVLLTTLIMSYILTNVISTLYAGFGGERR